MSKKEFNKVAKSNLAKLLATENITVEHRKVQTAFFDLGKRLLVVPIWKEMNVDILDMLLAHEIGHALFTPQDEWKEGIDKKIPHSYLNIVEDARIEKLIKRKYPGLSQPFIKGYRDLINNDFFKTKDKDINEMLLIDRLNMHFKMSHVESTIEFDGVDELEFVKRMSEVETFKEVETLAADLAEYCKDEAQTKGLDDHDFDFIDDADGDAADEVDNGDDNAESGDGDESGDESENKSPDSNKEGEEEEDDNGQDPRDSHGKKEYAPGDDYPDSETDAAWSNAQNDLLDEKSKDNQYYHVHEFTNLSNFVFDYKTVLKDFKDNRKKHMVSSSHYHSDLYLTAYPKLIADYKLFQKNQNKAVNYMVKEFELKKAATAHSRAMQSNSGVVDPLKLHSYKYNDDIFKRLTVTPDGKNHGLMMFIDWSGSMGDKIAPTIQQLMNLTMFCRKVNIPFEVYAFSNNTSYNNSVDADGNLTRKYPVPNYQDGDITIDYQMMLLNFISSKMTAKEYDEGMINLHFMGIKYGYDRYAYRGRNYDYEAAKSEQWKDDLIPMPNGYNLSSTPLNESIMAAMKMVPAFQKKYNIDKMNTVFLTDGASDGGERIVSVSDDDKDAEFDAWSSKRYGQDVKFKKYTSNANTLLTDRLTKKTLKVGDSRRGLTDSLLKVLKLRTGCKVLGFYVDSKRTLSNGTLNRYFPENNYWNNDVKIFDRKKVKAEFRKNKVLVVSENTGYDELYLLAGGDMDVTDTEMATPSEGAKKGEIKRLFASTLKSNKTSRVVLNKFITQVA